MLYDSDYGHLNKHSIVDMILCINTMQRNCNTSIKKNAAKSAYLSDHISWYISWRVLLFEDQNLLVIPDPKDI